MKSKKYFQMSISIFIFLLRLQAKQVISQRVVLSADYYYKKVTNELDKSEDEPSCPSQGILVQSIQIVLLKNDNCPNITKRNLDGTDLDDTEKRLVETIQKECNGRPKCDLQETWTIKPTFNCSGSLISADRIRITVQCVETKVDNKSVFDFYQIKQLQSPKNAIFISQNQKLNKTCQLTGNDSQIIITILRLEIGTTQSENKTDFFSIMYTDKNVNLYYDNKNISTFPAKNISVDNATLEVVMNNGFLWMKIEAENEVIMNCSRWIDANNQTNTSCCETNNNDTTPNIKYQIETSELNGTANTLMSVFIPLAAVIVILLLVIMCKKLIAPSSKPQRISQSKSSQETEENMKGLYYQLEKSQDTQEFFVSDNDEKSSSCDKNKENASTAPEQELVYSHLNVFQHQKPLAHENIYNV